MPVQALVSLSHKKSAALVPQLKIVPAFQDGNCHIQDKGSATTC